MRRHPRWILSQATCTDHGEKGCPVCFEPLNADDYTIGGPDEADDAADQVVADLREAGQQDYWDELAQLKAERKALQ